MPLSVNRLRDSDIAGVPDAEVFRCAVLAWCAAWHQVPAASLPDDDAALARMVGMGRDVKGWRKLRAAGALRGFKAASDGRLYHGVIVEKACDSWNSKLDFAWRRECDRLRKENKAAKDAGKAEQPMPPKPVHISSGWGEQEADVSAGIPSEDDDGSGGIPPVLPGIEGKGLEVKGVSEARARAESLPSGWKPDEATRAKLRGLGYSDHELDWQGTRHNNHFASNGKKRSDWNASYENWVMGEPVGKYAQREARNGPSSPSNHSPDPWDARVRSYRADLAAGKDSPFWRPYDWGPQPGLRGCVAPADILRRYEFEIPPPLSRPKTVGDPDDLPF